MKRLIPFLIVFVIPLAFAIRITGQDIFPAPAYKPSGEIIKMESKDWSFLQIDEFRLNNNVYNKSIVSRPYKQSVFLEKLNGKIIPGWLWDWQMCSDIACYPEIIYGRSPWDASPSDAPSVPELPFQIGTKHLIANFDISMKTQGISRLTFLVWVVSSLPGTNKKITHDIFITIDNHNMAPIGSPLGVVTVDGHRFDANSKQYVLPGGPDYPIRYVEFITRKPMLNGSLDLTAFIDFLVRRKVIKPNSYITTIELGNHVMGGSGIVEIKELSYSIE